jgi:hypothetical protein
MSMPEMTPRPSGVIPVMTGGVVRGLKERVAKGEDGSRSEVACNAPRSQGAAGEDPATRARPRGRPSSHVSLGNAAVLAERRRTIAEIFGTVLTRSEREIVEFIRKLTDEDTPSLTPDMKRKLKKVFA